MEVNPEENIYLTYKTRVTAEARLRGTGKFLHILVSWYSFCLIVLSLIDTTEKYRIEYANVLIISLSIGIFGLSLFIYGEKYFEQAAQFRQCYLRLQDLYKSTQPTEAKMTAYADILGQYENQRDDDYDNMVFDAWLRNQTLRNANSEIKIGLIVGAKVVAKRIVRYGFFIALFILPCLFAAFLLEPVEQTSAIPPGDISSDGQ